MKLILLISILLIVKLAAAQGSSCASAISLVMDGTIRSYTTSNTTGKNVNCAGSGSSPVTWFSFTTNSAAECPLLNIKSPTAEVAEVALYSSCSSSDEATSGMCFTDGEGLWAPAETFTVSANTTYFLRVKTSATGLIEMAAQSHDPANTKCAGALSIDETARADNNACHKPSTEVTPDQLCATTLENTAFYQYYVAQTGISIINIKNVMCDNIGASNSNGFQVGFFTGNCGALTKLSCEQLFGTSAQSTTVSLPAGTRVTVAIDGVGGSNCQYEITAFNAYGVLASGFRNFSVWKQTASNILRWDVENDTASWYEIERSSDGVRFTTIGKVKTASRGQTHYSFEDRNFSTLSLYRVKQVSVNGRILLSDIVKITRTTEAALTLKAATIVTDYLNVKLYLPVKETVEYWVTSIGGVVLTKGKLVCQQGTNWLNRSMLNMPAGRYLVSFLYKGQKQSLSFMKLY